MPNPPQLRPVFQDDAPPALVSPMTGSMASAPPDMGVTPAPMVSRIPTTGEQNIAHDEAKLQKVQWNQEHPWGTPENHPGKLGKVAHAFSVLGNIAGNIVAPGVMANIPQTQLGMKTEEGQLAKRVQGEQTSEAENQLRGAETQKSEAEALESPQKAADTHSMVDPNIAHINAETSALLHPQAKTDFQAWQLQNPGKPISAWLEEKASHAPDKLDPIKEQAKQEYMKLHPGATIDQFLHDYAVNTQMPQRAPINNIYVPNAQGGFDVQGATAGSHIAGNALTSAGMNAMNTPTAATRTMAETAPKVIDLTNRTEQLIDQQIKSLGPAQSRWAEFMAGKVGAPNPEFTKLRTNVGLLQTSLMRMHVGARGGEKIMEHFADLIDSSKQDPQNLKAALEEIRAYATEVGHSGGGAAAETDKANAAGQAGQPIVQHSPSTGQYRYSTDGGKTWQAGQPKAQ